MRFCSEHTSPLKENQKEERFFVKTAYSQLFSCNVSSHQQL